MAAHFNILAWRIPWTEEPGRLQSIGSHRVGHDSNDLAHMHVDIQIRLNSTYFVSTGLPCGTVVKNLPANAGNAGSIPELGRFPGEGNGNSLQYSYLGNSMHGGTWWGTVHGVAKSQTRLSN